MPYKYLTLICMLFLCLTETWAQNVTLFNSKQGLSNSCTNCIFEDSRHNVWLATQNGLNRFDGVKINVYYHNDKDASSLLNDEVVCVYEYDHDNIVIGTGGGIQIYNYNTNKFTSLPFVGINGDTITVRFHSVESINEGGKRRVMACFSGYGNAELINNKGVFSLKHITEFNVKDCNNPNRFFQDKKNRIWIIDNKGSIYRYKKNNTKKYTEVQQGLKMCLSKTGHLYLATSNQGVYRYDEKNDKFVLVAAPNELGGVVYGINPWAHGRILICTDGGGLRIYDEETDRTTESPIKINNFDLSTSNVKDAICDSYENVWASIYWMGVMIKPHNQSAFDYVGRNSITKNTIGTNSVFAIAPADSKHIWVAPDNDGLYLVSNDGTSSTHYSKESNPGMPKAFTYIYTPKAGKGGDAGTATLLGTYTDGLWQVNNGAFSFITKEINQIFEIQPADKGNVWIATMGNGIYYYNPSTKQYIRYVSDWSKGAEGSKIIGNPFVYSILQNGNQLFFGTADGLHICKYEGDGIIREESKKLLRSITVKHFAISDDKKHVWVATTNGLYRLDVKTNDMKRYTTSEGLANNSVKSVYVDKTNIWITTDNGLSCLNTKDDKFSNFFSQDGIQDNEFNRGAIIHHDNKIYAGGISGLTFFNTSYILSRKADKNNFKIKLVDLLIGGVAIHKEDTTRNYSILDDVLNDCANVTLSHKDNHFILELWVEGLSNQYVTFEYSINGGEWKNQGGGTTRLVFDQLKAGVHNIRIRALAFDAVSEERLLVVKVKPVWYASWWANLIYIILAGILLYLFINYRKRQHEARQLIIRNRHQQQLNEARLQFFMNLSHEIRTPMTLIFAPLEKLLRMDKDPECHNYYNLIKQNANRILRLINQMMDVRKIEEGKYQLNYHKVEIISFAQNIFDVFKTQAESRKIDYTFTHENLSSLYVNVDPENVDKMIMNLLSNSFKFTPDNGTINLDIRLSDNNNDNSEKPSFYISVKDSGVGIPDKEKTFVFDRFYSGKHSNGYIGTGIGLNLTANLVKLHDGTIDVKDNPSGKGTVFLISLPINVEQKDNIIPSDLHENINHSEDVTMAKEEEDTNKAASTIILVEDDPAIRQYVHFELSSTHNVIDFSDGQQAWTHIISHPNDIHLLISDIMMPVMDGLTLCQKVKSNYNTNHIPVLLMTALGSDEDRIIGITNGADAYLSKPFNIDILCSTVDNLLRNRQLLQGRFKSEKLHEETIEKVELESPDENLMRRIMKVINENIDNEELSVEMIADMVGISRVHFYRKMKDMTGQSPREFVKYVRLKEAARLLSTKKMDISSVSIACGFKSPSSFSTYFKALYGLSPSEWVKKQAASQQVGE